MQGELHHLRHGAWLPGHYALRGARLEGGDADANFSLDATQITAVGLIDTRADRRLFALQVSGEQHSFCAPCPETAQQWVDALSHRKVTGQGDGASDAASGSSWVAELLIQRSLLADDAPADADAGTLEVKAHDAAPREAAALPTSGVLVPGSLVVAKYSDVSKTWKRAVVISSHEAADGYSDGVRVRVRFDGHSDLVDLPRDRVKAVAVATPVEDRVHASTADADTADAGTADAGTADAGSSARHWLSALDGDSRLPESLKATKLKAALSRFLAGHGPSTLRLPAMDGAQRLALHQLANGRDVLSRSERSEEHTV